MRFDGHDPSRTDPDPGREIPPPPPLDAAESTWDPWLWALYLRELEAERRPLLH